MHVRYLTFDIQRTDQDEYVDFFKFLREIKAEQITESTYRISGDISLENLKTTLKETTKRGDNIYIIYVPRQNILEHFQIR